MAVTHADLAPTRRGIGSTTAGVILMLFSILLGLLCFVLCLIAEATRSQIVREASGDQTRNDCRYSGNGKTPLISAAGAFLSLAIGVVAQHAYLLLIVSKSDPDPSLLITWDHEPLNTLTWQAAFFFITTWICFSTGEVLLLIGLSAESGHLKGWLTPRRSCFVAPEGLFSSAGVLGITTVFLASGLSITARRAQWLLHDQENARREVMEASVLYSSPPHERIMTLAGESETTIVRHVLYDEPGLIEYLRAFDKII